MAHLELGRVLVGTNFELLGNLLQNLLAVVCPESFGGVFATVLEKNLLSSGVLKHGRESGLSTQVWDARKIASKTHIVKEVGDVVDFVLYNDPCRFGCSR